MTAPEVFYRYEDVQYAPSVDQFDNIIRGSGRLVVHLRTYPVIRQTPCGVRIDTGMGGTRFVSNQYRKQFAHSTKEAAKASFIARKKRQASIYQARVNQAETAIRMIELGLDSA